MTKPAQPRKTQQPRNRAHAIAAVHAAAASAVRAAAATHTPAGTWYVVVVASPVLYWSRARTVAAARAILTAAGVSLLNAITYRVTTTPADIADVPAGYRGPTVDDGGSVIYRGRCELVPDLSPGSTAPVLTAAELTLKPEQRRLLRAAPLLLEYARAAALMDAAGWDESKVAECRRLLSVPRGANLRDHLEQLRARALAIAAAD